MRHDELTPRGVETLPKSPEKAMKPREGGTESGTVSATKSLPQDLADVVMAWESIPPRIRSVIVMLASIPKAGM